MVNSTEVNLKLKKLNETQDSIVATSKWIFANSVKEPNTFDVILFTISSYLNSSDPQYQVSNKKKLTLVYLLNDLSHLIKFKHADKAEFVQTLDEQIPNLINEAMNAVPGDLQQKIVRVVKIWKQRNVYPEKVLSQINTSVQSSSAGDSKVSSTGADRIVKELKVINDIYTKYKNTGSTKLDLKKEIIKSLDVLIAKEKNEYLDMKRRETNVKNRSTIQSVPVQQPIISATDPSSVAEEIPTYAASSSSSSDSDSDAETQEKQTEQDTAVVEKHGDANGNASRDANGNANGNANGDANAFSEHGNEAVGLPVDNNAHLDTSTETNEQLEEYDPGEQQRAQKKPRLDASPPANGATVSAAANQKPVLLTSNIQDLLNKLSQSKK